MRRLWLGVALAVVSTCSGQQPFTVRQALSAPVASELSAAPVGGLFAWVENAEGRRNLWVGGANVPARMLTHYADDDGQEIRELAWSPDAKTIAYTYGAESGANGKPANPAHLQRETPVVVMLVPADGHAGAVTLGEGSKPLFSRDGRGLYFVRSGQIWTASTPGAEGVHGNETAHRLIFDRGSAHELTLSPDGQTLAFISRRSEPDEPAHSYVALFDLQKKVLTFPAASTGSDSAPVWSPDGRYLVWLRAPFTDSPEFALHRMSANPWSIQVLEVATGKVRQVFAAEANKPGSVLPRMGTGEPRLWWTADGRIVFASEATRWVHLYALDPLHPGLAVLLTPGAFEVDDPAMSADGRTMVYDANDTLADPLHPDAADVDRRHLWGLDLTAAQPVPVFLTRGAGIEVHPALTADGGTLAALVADARTPMMPAVISADGVKLPMRAEALPAGYPAAAMVVPQAVVFRAKDGVTVHGQVFVPELDATADLSAASRIQPRDFGRDDSSAAGSARAGFHELRALSKDSYERSNDKSKGLAGEQRRAKRPAVIYLHGGPQQQMLLGYPARGYYSKAYAMNEYLVSRGFIVLSLNYRCGTGYGLAFRQCAGGGPTGAKEYADVLAAVAYLRSRGDVDMKRVGLWGGSYGGYLTALGLARNSDLFAAGVDLHGVHDWNLEDNAGDWLRGSNAERDAIAVKAKANSPIGALASWRSPVLLIHGDDDANVAYAQTPLLAEALRAKGVRVEELIFPDEVHGFLLHKDWVKAYEAAAAFFERELQPGR